MIDLARELQCGRPGCSCARNGDTHCPNVSAHNGGDKNPSLTVTVEGDRILFYCHKGCSQQDVVQGLTSRGLWPLTDARESVIPINRGRERVSATYEYRSADGELIALHDRVEGPDGKTFRWRTPTNETGLAPLRELDLPLYNLRGILEQPDVHVWLVEGEKAADACTAAGLVATTLAGGASQKNYGNALDPLLSRDVILWPDNDDAGRQLMANVRGFLPNTRTVEPAVKAKGDAYDYFAAGGTVEALYELTRANGIEATVVDPDTVHVKASTPAAVVLFEFSQFSIAKRELQAEMRITVERTNDDYDTRLNLLSTSGRESARREIQNAFPKREGVDWAQIFPKACALAGRAYRQIDQSIDLLDVPEPEEREWLVDGFAPRNKPTILFGPGGSGKSFLAGDIMLHALYGEPWMGRKTRGMAGVLVVDYEDEPSEWRLRLAEICAGHGWEFPIGYRYMPGRAIPLADQAETIIGIIKRNGIELIVVDSAVSASGGELIDNVAVGRLMNFLATLPATSILIAHNTKEGDENYPYGSAMWSNLARATHHVKSRQAPGSNTLSIDIWNRKGNRGKKAPIPITITFPPDDGGPVTISHDYRTPIDQTVSEDVHSGGHKWKIALALETEPMEVNAVSIATGITQETVRRVLNRHEGDLFTRVPDTFPVRWARLSPREAQAQ